MPTLVLEKPKFSMSNNGTNYPSTALSIITMTASTPQAETASSSNTISLRHLIT